MFFKTAVYNALKIIENYIMPDPYAAAGMEELTVANVAECYGMLDRVISLRAVVDLDVFLGCDSPESLLKQRKGTTIIWVVRAAQRLIYLSLL